MHFNNSTLENIVTKLIEHLQLCGMHYIAEVHVGFHVALKGDFDRLWNLHTQFTGRKCQGNGAGISAKCHTLRHAGMRITTNNN